MPIQTSFSTASILLKDFRASPLSSKLIASHSSHDSAQHQSCLPCRLSSKFINLPNSNTLISPIQMANLICSLIEPPRDSSKTLMPFRQTLRWGLTHSSHHFKVYTLLSRHETRSLFFITVFLDSLSKHNIPSRCRSTLDPLPPCALGTHSTFRSKLPSRHLSYFFLE